MLKAKVIETLLYGCATWTLGQKHFAEPRTADHHHLLLQSIAFQHRQRADRLISYAKTLKKAQCGRAWRRPSANDVSAVRGRTVDGQ